MAAFLPSAPVLRPHGHLPSAAVSTRRRCAAFVACASSTPVTPVTPAGSNSSPPAPATAPAPAAPPASLLATPEQAYAISHSAALSRFAAPLRTNLIMGVLGGMYVSVGAYLSVAVGGSTPGLAASNPGLSRALFGSIGLPLGLLLCVLTRANLFTANTAVLSTALLDPPPKPTPRSPTAGRYLRVLVLSFAANLAASAGMAALVAAAGAPSAEGFAALVARKMALPVWKAFLRGVLCNWLVCTAVWWANACGDLASRAVVIWANVCAFAAIGFEHSVANMFLVPMAMAMGAKVTWAEFLVRNLLPVALGNWVGGALLVALPSVVLYGSRARAE